MRDLEIFGASPPMGGGLRVTSASVFYDAEEREAHRTTKITRAYHNTCIKRLRDFVTIDNNVSSWGELCMYETNLEFTLEYPITYKLRNQRQQATICGEGTNADNFLLWRAGTIAFEF